MQVSGSQWSELGHSYVPSSQLTPSRVSQHFTKRKVHSGLSCRGPSTTLSLSLFLSQVIVSQASVQRCNATVDFLTNRIPFFPPTINSPELHSFFVNMAGEMVGSKNVRDRQPLMGAEDFAFYAEVIPSTYYYFVGMYNKTRGPQASHHSTYFTVNEDALPYGAAAQAALAAHYLLEHEQPAATPDKAKAHEEL